MSTARSRISFDFLLCSSTVNKSTLTHHKHAQCRQPLIMAPDIREESERARETTAERAKVAATDWGGRCPHFSCSVCAHCCIWVHSSTNTAWSRYINNDRVSHRPAYNTAATVQCWCQCVIRPPPPQPPHHLLMIYYPLYDCHEITIQNSLNIRPLSWFAL